MNQNFCFSGMSSAYHQGSRWECCGGQQTTCLSGEINTSAFPDTTILRSVPYQNYFAAQANCNIPTLMSTTGQPASLPAFQSQNYFGEQIAYSTCLGRQNLSSLEISSSFTPINQSSILLGTSSVSPPRRTYVIQPQPVQSRSYMEALYCREQSRRISEQY